LAALSLFNGGKLFHRAARLKVGAPAPAAPGGRVFLAATGPWGTLECTRIALEVPREFIFTSLPQMDQPVWHFNGWSREAVAKLFEGAELTPGQRASLFERSNWDVTAAGVKVHPEPALILGLSATSRERIYTVLTKYWENEVQRLAYVFKPELLDERFEGSELRPELIGEVKRLLYRQGKYWMFADLYSLLGTLHSEAEKQALAKVVSRQWTYLVRLRVTPEADLDELTAYWSAGGRSKDVRPLLESLRRLPQGASLDISHLLTQFARRRIYTFPAPTADALERRQDCHWTAYNFFSQVPDDRFSDPEVLKKVFAGEYEKVSGQPRMGDLVVLMNPQGQMLHSAVYVADDLVFCKNGAHFSHPWMLMKLPDMLDYYLALYQPDHAVLTGYFRRKSG
ncbi:MAG TPA: hypothetical protein VI454_04450, partial [Verrucomicrobiae bacterium]